MLHQTGRMLLDHTNDMVAWGLRQQQSPSPRPSASSNNVDRSHTPYIFSSCPRGARGVFFGGNCPTQAKMSIPGTELMQAIWRDACRDPQSHTVRQRYFDLLSARTAVSLHMLPNVPSLSFLVRHHICTIILCYVYNEKCWESCLARSPPTSFYGADVHRSMAGCSFPSSSAAYSTSSPHVPKRNSSIDM